MVEHRVQDCWAEIIIFRIDGLSRDPSTQQHDSLDIITKTHQFPFKFCRVKLTTCHLLVNIRQAEKWTAENMVPVGEANLRMKGSIEHDV